jgi:phage gp45-like
MNGFVNDLERRVRIWIASLLRRGILRALDGQSFAQIEGYADERTDDVELWQQYGFASRPAAGSEVLYTNLGAQGGKPIAFATSHRASKPHDMAANEVRMYSAGDANITATGAIHIGATDASQSAVLGDTLITMLRAAAATMSSSADPKCASAGSNLQTALGTAPAPCPALSSKVKVS